MEDLQLQLVENGKGVEVFRVAPFCLGVGAVRPSTGMYNSELEILITVNGRNKAVSKGNISRDALVERAILQIEALSYDDLWLGRSQRYLVFWMVRWSLVSLVNDSRV